MIFTKIGIENYRAIDHLEYEPQNRIACLSGPNGRGKSSFFSALYTGLTGNIDKTNVQNGKEYAEVQIETLDRDQNMVSILQISLGGKAHGFNRGMKAFLFLKTCIFLLYLYTFCDMIKT